MLKSFATFMWESLDRKGSLWAAAGILVLVVVLSIPRDEPELPPHRSRAEELVRTFNARLSSGVGASGVRLELPRSASAEPAPRRDLFSPAPGIGLRIRAASVSGAATAPATPREAVSAILLDGDRPQAVVFGRAVAEGDSVNGYWVAEISMSSVLLWKAGTFRRLTYRRDP